MKTVRNIFYWEQAAANVFNIPPEDLFAGNRKRDAVSARYLCMNYMRTQGHSTIVSAARFGMKHCMTIRANKEINGTFQQDKKLKKILSEFNALCEVLKAKEQYREYRIVSLFESKGDIMNAAFSVMEEYATFMYSIKQFVNDKCDEADVLHSIIIAENALSTVKKYFTIE